MRKLDLNGNETTGAHVYVEAGGLVWFATTEPEPVTQRHATRIAAARRDLERTWRLPTEEELKAVDLSAFTDVEGKEWTWSSKPGVYVGIARSARPSYSTSDLAFARMVSG